LPSGRLLAVVLLGLLVWLPGLAQPFRADEIWSLRAVAMPWREMMAELRGDVHPPLYYWLLRAWVAIAGSGEVAARVLSLALSAAAAWTVGRTAREWFGERAQGLAVAVYCCSLIAVLAAQFVRMYALLGLVSAVSTMAFLRLSRQERMRAGTAALYVAANIAGTFTHVWFFFLLLAQGCVFLASRRGRGMPRMILCAVASLAPYALYWLPVLMQQIRKSSVALAWATRPTVADVAGAAMLLGGVGWFAAPFVWRTREADEARVRAWCWALAAITILVPLVISFWKPVFWARFTITALPALAVAAGSLGSGPGNGRASVWREVVLLAAGFSLAAALAAARSPCDSRMAAQYLSQNAQRGDLVVFTNLSRPPVDYYWTARAAEERNLPRENETHPGYDAPVTPEQMAREAQAIVDETSQGRYRRVFLLHGFLPAKERGLVERLDKGLERVAELCRRCEAMGSYYDKISVYRARR